MNNTTAAVETDGEEPNTVPAADWDADFLYLEPAFRVGASFSRNLLVAAALVASTTTSGIDPFVVDRLRQTSSVFGLRSVPARRRRLTIAEARRVAFQILHHAEAARLMAVEKEATAGLNWEYLH